MGIRANTGLANIEVNDSGEMITFYLTDNDFIKKFFDFVDWFRESGEKISGSEASDKDLVSIYEQQKNLSDTALDKLEDMFGEGTCKKIFGQMSPIYVCVVDVIAQIAEEVSRLVGEYNKDFVGKYSRGRKGARSK